MKNVFISKITNATTSKQKPKVNNIDILFD